MRVSRCLSFFFGGVSIGAGQWVSAEVDAVVGYEVALRMKSNRNNGEGVCVSFRLA